jgi:hypothetical protein
MNGNVAPRAFAAVLKPQPAMRSLRQLVKSRMALQAELPPFAANQQHPVSGAVRTVTTHTTFNFGRRVLMNKRTTLLDMALGACFRLGLYQARRVQGSVRTVAVRAFHQTFGNTVMNRLCKLTSNGGVTRVTKIRLGRFQEAACKPFVFIGPLRHLEEVSQRQWGSAFARVLHRVDEVAGMAVTTRGSGRQMTRMKEGVLLPAALVAREAAFGVLPGIRAKCKYQLVRRQRFRFITSRRLLTLDMRFTWPMARFAGHYGFSARLQPCV